tara:strand:+ start:1616 stop:1840 length:225 start_codon:yes stop_codon:yes gene_type:complete
MDISFCFLLKTLMLKYVVFLKLFIEEDFLLKENKINGGDNDKEVKEFTVLPIGLLALLIAITVTPVGNFDKVFL